VQQLTYTIEEVAERLGISRNSAYVAARGNRLPVPVLKIGKRMMVSREAFDGSLKAAPVDGAEPMPHTVQLAPKLHAEITAIAKAQDRSIKQVVERLIERALLLDRMLSR
jgi:excisionase family DNA binding protein